MQKPNKQQSYLDALKIIIIRQAADCERGTKTLLCARHCSTLCPVTSLWFSFVIGDSVCSLHPLTSELPTQGRCTCGGRGAPQSSYSEQSGFHWWQRPPRIPANISSALQVIAPATNTARGLQSLLRGSWEWFSMIPGTRIWTAKSPDMLEQISALPSHLPICAQEENCFMSIPWGGWNSNNHKE